MKQSREQSFLRTRIRQILSSKAKARVANILCHPWSGRAIARLSADRIRSGPLRIHTDGPTISAKTKAQIFWGIYESAEIRLARRHLRADLDLLEIGASLGVVSAHAVSCMSPNSRMVFVEANPDLIPTIRKNLHTNHADREVIVLNRAIDYESRTGSTRLRLTQETSGSQLGRFSEGGGDDARSVTIPATTIARLVSETALREFVLLSDIEGAEAGFILGDPRELDGCRQIVIELHDTEYRGQPVRWQELLAALTGRFGFRVLEGHGPVQVLER